NSCASWGASSSSNCGWWGGGVVGRGSGGGAPVPQRVAVVAGAGHEHLRRWGVRVGELVEQGVDGAPAHLLARRLPGGERGGGERGGAPVRDDAERSEERRVGRA